MLTTQEAILHLHTSMGPKAADVLAAWMQDTEARMQAAYGGLEAEVTLTAAQVKLLNTTPITLVAAPGAGKAIVLDEATLILDWVTPKYDGIAEGEDLNIRYTNGSGALVATVETIGFMDQEADTVRYVRGAAGTDIAVVANAALVIYMATGNIATGNSPLIVRVRYHIIDTV